MSLGTAPGVPTHHPLRRSVTAPGVLSWKALAQFHASRSAAPVPAFCGEQVAPSVAVETAVLSAPPQARTASGVCQVGSRSNRRPDLQQPHQDHKNRTGGDRGLQGRGVFPASEAIRGILPKTHGGCCFSIRKKHSQRRAAPLLCLRGSLRVASHGASSRRFFAPRAMRYRNLSGTVRCLDGDFPNRFRWRTKASRHEQERLGRQPAQWQGAFSASPAAEKHRRGAWEGYDAAPLASGYLGIGRSQRGIPREASGMDGFAAGRDAGTSSSVCLRSGCVNRVTTPVFHVLGLAALTRHCCSAQAVHDLNREMLKPSTLFGCEEIGAWAAQKPALKAMLDMVRAGLQAESCSLGPSLGAVSLTATVLHRTGCERRASCIHGHKRAPFCVLLANGMRHSGAGRPHEAPADASNCVPFLLPGQQPAGPTSYRCS